MLSTGLRDERWLQAGDRRALAVGCRRKIELKVLVSGAVTRSESGAFHVPIDTLADRVRLRRKSVRGWIVSGSTSAREMSDWLLNLEV
jgi:hypothetical protein